MILSNRCEERVAAMSGRHVSFLVDWCEHPGGGRELVEVGAEWYSAANSGVGFELGQGRRATSGLKQSRSEGPESG